MRPQRRAAPEGVVDHLVAAGFDNLHDDLETEYWLVFAARSMPELSLLKSFYTAEQRKELARLLHRIEYDVDLTAQTAAFWAFYARVGLFPDYAANFVKEACFHPERFYRHLFASSDAAQRGTVRAMLDAAREAATTEEEARMLARLVEEFSEKGAEA